MVTLEINVGLLLDILFGIPLFKRIKSNQPLLEEVGGLEGEGVEEEVGMCTLLHMIVAFLTLLPPYPFPQIK